MTLGHRSTRGHQQTSAGPIFIVTICKCRAGGKPLLLQQQPESWTGLGTAAQLSAGFWKGVLFLSPARRAGWAASSFRNQLGRNCYQSNREGPTLTTLRNKAALSQPLGQFHQSHSFLSLELPRVLFQPIFLQLNLSIV